MLLYVFTEQGVAMLSSVLKSTRAIDVNVQIMRAFVRMREMLATHSDVLRKINALEQKCDDQFIVVFDAIRGADVIAREAASPDRVRALIGRSGMCQLILSSPSFSSIDVPHGSVMNASDSPTAGTFR